MTTILLLGALAACDGDPVGLAATGGEPPVRLAAAAAAPGQVSNLSVAAASGSSLTISFTEVDDGLGGAASYNIRYIEGPMGWRWGSATSVQAGSCASPLAGLGAGQKHTCTIEGLSPLTRYDVRLVALRGTLNVDAVFGSLSNVATGTTTEPGPAVASVAVTPEAWFFDAFGSSLNATAAALDGQGQPATEALLWSSTDTAVATVDAAGRVTSVADGSAGIVVRAACCDAADTLSVSVQQVAAAIAMSADSIELLEGAGEQLAAVASDANGNPMPAAQVAWASSAPAVASVSATGAVSALTAGEAIVTASVDAAAAATRVVVSPVPDPGQVGDLAVIDASDTSLVITFTEVDDGLGAPAGYDVRYYAGEMGWNWGRSTSAAEGSCATPLAGAAAGAALTCTISGLQPETRYDVRLVAYRGTMGAGPTYGPLSNVATGVTLEPAPRVVAVVADRSAYTFDALGSTLALSAEARDGGGVPLAGEPLEWSSTDPAVASVDGAGVVQANADGRTSIVVKAACCDVADTVVADVAQAVASVVVSPVSLVLGPAGAGSLTAAAADADGNAMPAVAFSWSSSDADVASVASDGSVAAVAPGSATISASAGGITGSASVQVNPPSDPGTVTDLAVVDARERGVTLRFTEVDDGTGSPADYDVRFYAGVMGWNWGRATSVASGSCRTVLVGAAVGQSRTCTIEGLDPDTRYDFRMVAFRIDMSGRTYGSLSNVATASTQPITGPPSEPVAEIVVSPGSYTFDRLGDWLQLSVAVRDAAGAPVTGQPLVGESLDPSVATVDAGGRVTAVGVGSTGIVVRAQCCSAADTVAIVVSTEPSSTPGMAVIVDRAFSSKAATDGDRGSGSFPNKAGGSEGWDGVEFRQANYTIVQDPTAPESASGVMRVRYPAGLPQANGPGAIQTQPFTGPAHGNLRLTEIGVRTRIKLGSSYMVGGVSNKLFFHRTNASGMRPEPFLALFDAGGGRFQMAVNFQGTPDNSLGFFRSSSPAGNALVRNRWYEIETYGRLNSANGVPDGVFRVWIDGVLVLERTNVQYRNGSGQIFWDTIHVSPTFGGGGGYSSVPYDFDFFIDHMTISGR